MQLDAEKRRQPTSRYDGFAKDNGEGRFGDIFRLARRPRLIPLPKGNAQARTWGPDKEITEFDDKWAPFALKLERGFVHVGHQGLEAPNAQHSAQDQNIINVPHAVENLRWADASCGQRLRVKAIRNQPCPVLEHPRLHSAEEE